MSKRLVFTLVVAATALTVSRRAEAIYSYTSVPFAWKWAQIPADSLWGQDDAISSLINLPFPFPFQDDVFDQIRIHTNGFVTLSKSGLPCGNCLMQNFTANGNTLAPDYTIAPWWADWNPSVGGGEIWYGPVDDAFVVEWWTVPYGGAAGQMYSFSLNLFPDGRFRFLYATVNAGVPSRDYGNTASIGYQGRAMAGFGSVTQYTTGSGGTLATNTAFEYSRASDNLNNALFNVDGDVPDIVERWAPVIWADISQAKGRCDYMTYPTFDGNLNGADNEDHGNDTAYQMPAVVHYSLVNGTTHDFIGYYFYHAWDCTAFYDSHPHDWEGITIAVNRNTGAVDAVLSNVHGREIPYHSPFDNGLINVDRHSYLSADSPYFSHFSMRSGSLAWDTVGVGIEAQTHSTWGRWHNRCVIGTEGSPSGCNDEHGGDGIVYVYGLTAGTVGPISGHPNWFSGSRVSYTLRPLETLFGYALESSPSYCGNNSSTSLFTCQTEGRPWDQMDGDDEDAGDLPWVWGEHGTVTSSCTGQSMTLQPGFLFGRYFIWAPGRFAGCSYSANPFMSTLISKNVCSSIPSSCPDEYGPVSEETGKWIEVCPSNRTGLTGFRCAGSYCDDMYITCSDPPGMSGFTASSLAGYWTGWFSEEAPNSKFCSPDRTNNNLNGIIDGVMAYGSYGDNVNFHCAAITSGHLSSCTWTGWISEEQGAVSFNGKYAVGAECSGSYCDNKRFLICNIGP